MDSTNKYEMLLNEHGPAMASLNGSLEESQSGQMM
jgi:hypothetical protein